METRISGALSPTQLAALLERLLPAQEGAALAALLGQDAQLTLLDQEGGVLRLALPNGSEVQAKGELPFPEGTQLRVRVMAAPGGEAGLTLRLLEALPPAGADLLAPLLQGEAVGLMARLRATGGGEAGATGETGKASLPAELMALKQLLNLVAPGGESQGTRPALPLPDAVAILRALPRLPVESYQALSRALSGQASLPPSTLAPMVERWLRQGAADLGGKPLETLLAALPEELAAELERQTGNREVQVLEASLLQAFQGLAPADGKAGPQEAKPLDAWLRQLLQQAKEEKGGPAAQGARTFSPREASAQAAASPRTQAALQAKGAQGAQAPGAPPSPAQPETWETWIRGAARTLVDPAASPREAPFHALQAREGTAFFEIPLPWSPQAPLEMWVERDPEDEEKEGWGEAGSRRVLLGLSFSRLGETRVGLEKQGKALKVRIWTEHPELLKEAGPELAKELGAELQVLPLERPEGGGVPSIRSLATGSTLHALG